MKRFTVRVSPDAQEQILEQVFYIARDSVDNALAWEVRVRAAMNSIGDAPGHAVDEDASRRAGETIREFVFERTYLIHYRVDEQASLVDIVNFRHGARLPRIGEP
jgi:plasmid stabilization system protein ParE